MIVSNFEIGVMHSLGKKFQVTTYQLQITNLEATEIEFAIETHVAKAQDGVPPLDVLSSRLLHNPSSVPTLIPAWRSGGDVWVDAHTFRLGARLSTIFELRVGGTLLPGETQDQALLGHVVLRVPPVRQANHVISTVQGANPVRVLLSASRFDTRDAFANLARNLDGVTQLQLSGNDIFSSQSIPISTGRAENEIEPEGLRVKDVVGATARLRELGREGKITRGALLMSEEDRFPALVDLLAGLSADESGLAALNDLLAEVSADVRVRPQ